MTGRAYPKVAIVHFWFLGHAGGEYFIETLGEMFPQADLFFLVADPGKMSAQLLRHRTTTSFLQRIPGIKRCYRQLLLLHPLALEQFDLSDYDLILSSESGPAKGIVSPTNSCHICYCHSPMRYIWDFYPAYRRGLGKVGRIIFSLTAHYLRIWDSASAARVDNFVANSQNVAARVRKCYRRPSRVIYPPVDISQGRLAPYRADYYLVVGRLVDYKRVDLAIQACNQLGRSLRIVGDGDQYDKLRRQAGPTVTFLGAVGDEALRDNYAHCRALLFPGEEDFGMVPVEAQSFGRPIIAYGRGGALETVIGANREDPNSAKKSTGVFFSDQTCESLCDAILHFEHIEAEFSPEFIRSSVERFDVSRFKSEMYEFINDCLAGHHPSYVAATDPIVEMATMSLRSGK